MSSEAKQPQCQVTRPSASVTRAVGPGRRMAVALWQWNGCCLEGYVPAADLHLHGGRHGPCTLSPKPLCLPKAPRHDRALRPHPRAPCCGLAGRVRSGGASAVFLGLAKCRVKVKGRQGGREGEETGEEESETHSPGSTHPFKEGELIALHIRSIYSNTRSLLLLEQMSPFSRCSGPRMEPCRPGVSDQKPVQGAPPPHPPARPSPGQAWRGLGLGRDPPPGSGCCEQTGSRRQSVHSGHSHLLQLCTVMSYTDPEPGSTTNVFPGGKRWQGPGAHPCLGVGAEQTRSGLGTAGRGRVASAGPWGPWSRGRSHRDATSPRPLGREGAHSRHIAQPSPLRARSRVTNYLWSCTTVLGSEHAQQPAWPRRVSGRVGRAGRWRPGRGWADRGGRTPGAR